MFKKLKYKFRIAKMLAGDSKQAQQLHSAAADGSPDEIREIVKSGTRVDVRNRLEMTPLMSAAKNERLDNIAALLEAGADITARDFTENNVLHYSSGNKGVDCTMALISAGADPEAINNLGSKPLHAVSEDGSKELLEYYIGRSKSLEDTSDKDGTPLMVAARFGSLINLKTLIDHGADISVKGKYGCNLLHLAAENENSEVLQHVLKLGFPIESRDDSGETPLFKAAMIENPKNAKMLLNAGADINATLEEGQTVLHAAGFLGGEEVVELLAVSQSFVNQRDCDGQTALHVAAYKDNAESANALLNAGAEIDCRDNLGLTPIAHAAIANCIELVELLYDAGADIGVVGKDGQDLISLAKGAKKEGLGDESLKFLKEKVAEEEDSPIVDPRDSWLSAKTSKLPQSVKLEDFEEVASFDSETISEWAMPLVGRSTPVSYEDLLEKLGHSTTSGANMNWLTVAAIMADMGFGIAPHMALLKGEPSKNDPVFIYRTTFNHQQLTESKDFDFSIINLGIGAYMLSLGNFSSREMGSALRKVAETWNRLEDGDMDGIHANIDYLCANSPEPGFFDGLMNETAESKLPMRRLAVEFAKSVNAGKAKKLAAMESFYKFLELDPELAHSDLESGVPESMF